MYDYEFKMEACLNHSDDYDTSKWMIQRGLLVSVNAPLDSTGHHWLNLRVLAMGEAESEG